MNVTDLITDTLLQLLEEQDGIIRIQRNDLANQLGCVPSQINYVITSRFRKEQGYIVESRRGGGGFIKIIKVKQKGSEIILHIINSIGDTVDEATARILINTLFLDERVTETEAKIMFAVIADDNFKGMNDRDKQIIRARLLKSMLINLI